jgi:RsiW-degrading membrane proteinase PrsW (M82 family)
VSTDGSAGSAAWLPDPCGRNEVRYWDGLRWTAWVANAGVTTGDPMSAYQPPVSTAALRSGPPATPVSSDDKLPLDVLFPVRDWLTGQGWRQGRVGLFFAAAVAPFVLLQVTGKSENLSSVAWGFALYFAVMWLLAIRALVQPEPVDNRLLAKVAGFTVVAGVAIAVVLERALVGPDAGLATYVLGVGVPEELAKALPVFLFVFRGKQAFTPRTFLYIGVVSGLAFGAAESVSYSAAYASLPDLSASAFVAQEVWRLVSDSLFHACMAGITGYYLGLAYIYRRHSSLLIVSGLTLAAVLHGVYDTTANSLVGTAVAAAVVFVFCGYVRSGDSIVTSLGQRLGTATATTRAPAPNVGDLGACANNNGCRHHNGGSRCGRR